MSASKNPLALTESGQVSGRPNGGVAVFRGIPYARPPFGVNRFGRPVHPDRWEGVREAVTPGAGYVQRWQLDDPWNGYLNPSLQGEDMLTLEVSSPDPSPDARLPVMVWIHGGGFTEGVGSAPAHRGITFARDGVVHVSVNYRLALDGYGLLEDSLDTGTENLGLRDQVAALEWVQHNIAAFGGDPSHVTVAGQSGGAISVLCLMGSPLARGLFHRAIVESGFPGGVRSIADAEYTRPLIARAAGRPATRAHLRELTLAETRTAIGGVLAEFGQRSARDRRRPTEIPFMVTVGTESLREPLTTAATVGLGSEVPLLIGTTRDEMAGLLAKAGLFAPWVAPLTSLVLRRFGVPSGAPAAYRRASRAGGSRAEILTAAVTDAVARMPAIVLAEQRPGPTYLYEFTWQSPGLPKGLGADHVVDIPFMRDDLDTFRRSCSIGDAILGEHPPQALATAMHRAFADFVASGGPGWGPYTSAERVTMRFDAESAVVRDLAGSERAAWGRS